METQEERREQFRHQKACVLSFEGVDGALGSGYAEICDFSRSGIRFYSESALPRGYRIHLEIDLGDNMLRISHARVAWVARALEENQSHYYIGVEFIPLTPDEYREVVTSIGAIGED